MHKFIAIVSVVGGAMMAPGVLKASCSYTLDRAATSVTWTGYKTAEKLGVKGSFQKVSFAFRENAPTPKELFESLTFNIDTDSLASGDPGRDANLKNLVFNLNKGVPASLPVPKISGRVKSYDEKAHKAVGGIEMGGKLADKTFDVTEKGDEVVFAGSIDIVSDFGMAAHFAALAKACDALHKSKSWSEVGIQVQTKLIKTCQASPKASDKKRTK